MTAPKSEYRIRLVLEQREPDESLVWREAGVSEQNDKFVYLHTAEQGKYFHQLNELLILAAWGMEGE